MSLNNFGAFLRIGQQKETGNMKIKKVLIVMMAVFVSMGAIAADPAISGVMVQQRWPWSRHLLKSYE